ncbi:MAG: ArsA family ATPase, partial [Promethearchaeota archaeon]
MVLADLIQGDLRFLFLGGKGGVGKTSMAAALAIQAASQGKETLIISTDPAHSLSDSIDQQIGGSEFVAVKGVSNLYALEIDTVQSVEEIGDVLSVQDINNAAVQMGLDGSEDLIGSTPGIDETLAFARLLEFVEKPTHELVIFDTAPTGHTLRLLGLPEIMDSWLFKFISLRQRLSTMIGSFKRVLFGGTEDDTKDAIKTLKEMRRRIQVARTHLENSNETEFIVVTIPTMMAIWETERLIRALYEYTIPTNHVIINQVPPPNPSCQFCAS